MKLRYIIAFALVYTLIYIFLALDVIGMEGRGPLIFAAPLRPLGLPWLLLMAALFISREVTSYRNTIVFVGLMLAHYTITAFYLIPYLRFDSSLEGEALTRIMNLRPRAVYYALSWYIGGQVLIWIMFASSLRRRAFIS